MNSITRIDKASEALARSRATLYRDIKDKLLPPPFLLGGRSVGWLESEINLVQAARCAGKSEKEIRQIVEQLIQSRKQRFSALSGEVCNGEK
jgi:prophage regulatory protein